MLAKGCISKKVLLLKKSELFDNNNKTKNYRLKYEAERSLKIHAGMLTVF